MDLMCLLERRHSGSEHCELTFADLHKKLVDEALLVEKNGLDGSCNLHQEGMVIEKSSDDGSW